MKKTIYIIIALAAIALIASFIYNLGIKKEGAGPAGAGMPQTKEDLKKLVDLALPSAARGNLQLERRCQDHRRRDYCHGS